MHFRHFPEPAIAGNAHQVMNCLCELCLRLLVPLVKLRIRVLLFGQCILRLEQQLLRAAAVGHWVEHLTLCSRQVRPY